jgi:hypothetical protein
MKIKLTMIVGGAVLLGVLVLGLLRTYGIEPVERPQILCSRTECLLIVDVEYNGWVSNMLRDVGDALKSSFGIANRPTQKRSRTVVFRIKSDKTFRYDLNDPIANVGVFENVVYARTDRLQRWGRSGLEEVSAVERERYHEADVKGAVLQGDFVNRNGWSAKSYLNPGAEFNATLDDRPVTISREKVAPNSSAVYVTRSGENRETIWLMDESFRRVSLSEYSHVFEH